MPKGSPFSSIAFLIVFVLLLPLGSRLGAGAEEAQLSAGEGLLYPNPDSADGGAIDWLEVIGNQIPPLRHGRGDRWPLILWDSVGYEPLPAEAIHTLLARGITQHIHLNEAMIPVARALQAAGSPVVIMEGKSGVWPYNLVQDKAEWAHQYPEDLQVPRQWRETPSPTRFRGWAVAADRIRVTMEKFREAGVTVDAVWLDYEGEPSMANYHAALLSPSTRGLLPPEVLMDEDAFYRFRRQLWVQLLSAYVAAPVREVYPQVSVTNWVATLSSPENPPYGWANLPHPPLGPSLFTATCPVAYAIDTAFLNNWKSEYPLDQRHVDQLFMHVMLRQVSADTYNRMRMAPYLDSIPWVARWVWDQPGQKAPVMSRAWYRESLRHLWLRGIDGMQVFNPVRPGYAAMAIYEIIDASAIYDEVLAYRDFLERGEVMNLKYPAAQDDGVLWSGLLLGDEAIVRIFSQGPSDTVIELEPWEGYKLELNAVKQGATYHLSLNRAGKRVEILALPE